MSAPVYGRVGLSAGQFAGAKLKEADIQILVVEDEEALGEILCSLLEERGYQATHACNGVKALERLKSDAIHWQLVLSDIVMPEMNGIQFLQHARQLYPELPVIM